MKDNDKRRRGVMCPVVTLDTTFPGIQPAASLVAVSQDARNTETMTSVQRRPIEQTHTNAHLMIVADDRQHGRLEEENLGVVGGSCLANHRVKSTMDHSAYRNAAQVHLIGSCSKETMAEERQTKPVQANGGFARPAPAEEDTSHEQKRKLKVRHTKKTKAKIKSNKQKLKENDIGVVYADEITQAYDRIIRLSDCREESVSTIPASTPSTLRHTSSKARARNNRDKMCTTTDIVGKDETTTLENARRLEKQRESPLLTEPKQQRSTKQAAASQASSTRRKPKVRETRVTTPVSQTERSRHKSHQSPTGKRSSDPSLKSQYLPANGSKSSARMAGLTINSTASTIYEKLAPDRPSWCSRFAINRAIAAATDPGFTFHAKSVRYDTPSDLSLSSPTRMQSEQLILYGSSTPSDFSTTSTTTPWSTATRIDSTPLRPVICDRCFTATPECHNTPTSSNATKEIIRSNSCIPGKEKTNNHIGLIPKTTSIDSQYNKETYDDTREKRCAVTTLSFIARDSLSANTAGNIFKASSTFEMSSGNVRSSGTAHRKSERSSASTIKSVCSTARGSSRRSSASTETKMPPWRY